MSKQENSENSMNQAETEQKANDEKSGSHYSVKFALIGGVVGAGIGLLVNPETSKKVMKNLGESEFVRTASQEFKNTAQDLLVGPARESAKQIASGYISKIEEGLLSDKTNKNKESESSEYEEVKEENKNLNERLDKIEKMLNNLVDSQ